MLYEAVAKVLAFVRRFKDEQVLVVANLSRFAQHVELNLKDFQGLVPVEASGGVEFPGMRTSFRDRHALVVARGPGHKRDLRIVRSYIRDFKPVLLAVDGGADALLDIGLTPDIIIGDFDSLSDRAMRCNAELVHHVHPDGRAAAWIAPADLPRARLRGVAALRSEAPSRRRGCSSRRSTPAMSRPCAPP